MQCKKNTNLECKESICTCVHPNFWDGNKCSIKGSYLDDCSFELGCNEAKLLNCSITGDLINRCDCDQTRYWSSKLGSCTERYLNGIDCENDNQCRTDFNLKCLQVHDSKKCMCSSDFYWNLTLCGKIKL